jgi:hypothetical protein
MSRSDVGWSNPRILLLFTAVFLCGLAVGAAATSSLFHGKWGPGAKRMDLATLRTELHLTPQQEVVVEKELDDYVKYYQNIEEEREDVAEHGKMRILSVLSPEQKQRFLELFGTEPLLKVRPAP